MSDRMYDVLGAIGFVFIVIVTVDMALDILMKLV